MPISFLLKFFAFAFYLFIKPSEAPFWCSMENVYVTLTLTTASHIINVANP